MISQDAFLTTAGSDLLRVGGPHLYRLLRRTGFGAIVDGEGSNDIAFSLRAKMLDRSELTWNF